MNQRLQLQPVVLCCCFFIFSWWLMNKSFGYDRGASEFRIARHQVGDFGLHLSLIRSIAWGNNYPPQHPHFPGKPLPYHYYFDLLAGLLEKAGIRIDHAVNGVSAIAYSLLLLIIVKWTQLLFGKNVLLGLTAVVLFICRSSWSFLSFFVNRDLGNVKQMITDMWYLPDYLHKGPFDGSLISIFFTQNVYLNQRHLIVALVISFGVMYWVSRAFLRHHALSLKEAVIIGLLVGVSSRIHSLIFAGTLLTLMCLFVLFKRIRFLPVVLIAALFTSLPHLVVILQQDLSHVWWNPGFLSERPLTILSLVEFWWLNLGIALVTIPVGLYLAKKPQRKIFLSALPLFIFGNLFQFSFRIDHNHSLFNMFIIFSSMFSAYFLVMLFKQQVWKKLLAGMLLILLALSGLLDLMAIKNDFQFTVADAPANKLMQWIKGSTSSDAVFIAPQQIFDPVTLSGRSNFRGHTYYLEVIGYDTRERDSIVKNTFEATTVNDLRFAQNVGIDYLLIPQKTTDDFRYSIDSEFFMQNLPVSYRDDEYIVFQL